MEIRGHHPQRFASPPAAPRQITPDRVESGVREDAGTYGPAFARKMDVKGAEAPSRTGLKAAGLALAVVVAAALCDALTGGGLQRTRD